MRRGIWCVAGIVFGLMGHKALGAEPVYAVRLLGAELGRLKADGLPWDGPPNDGVRKAAKSAAGALRLVPGESVVINGQAAGNLLAELGGMTATALNAPDSYGRVALEIDAREVAHRRVPKQMDTYSPQWNGLVLNDVDISRATVRVRLSEWDPVTDDPIGTCELRAHVLVAAARANETVLVPCGKETAGRFLLLRLSVQKQAVPTSERTAQP